MILFLMKRLVAGAVGLFITLSFVFFALRFIPGGPFDQDRALPTEVLASLKAHYGMNLSLSEQYLQWLGNLLSGELGHSLSHRDHEITALIQSAVMPSFTLGFMALSISLFAAIGLSFVQVTSSSNIIRIKLSKFISLLCVSMPVYLSASCLVLFFGIHLQWLPTGLWEGPASSILPAITLAIRPTGMIARMLSENLSAILNSDYVRACYAKGLPKSIVFLKHAIPNALLPVFSVLGPLAADVMTGSFVVESLFQIPGLGKFFVSSVLNRDYPLALAITLVYGVLLTLTTLASDVIAAYIDPRFKESLFESKQTVLLN